MGLFWNRVDPVVVELSPRAEAAAAALDADLRGELGQRMTYLARELNEGRLPMFQTLTLLVGTRYLAHVQLNPARRKLTLVDVESVAAPGPFGV